MIVRQRTVALCILSLFLLTFGFSYRQGSDNGSVFVISQASVPKQWKKDAVPRFSPDGTFVEGIVFARPNWTRWTWNPTSGFTVGEAISIDQADAIQYAPLAGALKEWNTKYGRSSSQGLKFGNHSLLETRPTGMSRDGSVVVGWYADDATGDRSDETYGGTAQDGKSINFFKRCFVWTKQAGFRDLWDFIDPTHGIEPAYKGGSYYCAVSPDGKKVVAVTDKIVLASLERPQTEVKGVVKSFRDGEIVLLADSVTLMDGKIVTLKPPREKRILISAGIATPTGVKVGNRIVAAGTDGGAGKPLTATAITLVTK